MSIQWKSLNAKPYPLLLLVIVLSLLFHPAPSMAQKKIFWGSSKKTIVIDPGHGGHDHGAKGPDKNLEKAIVLRLARLIEDQLKEHHHVILTRTDDYSLELSERSNMANHAKADLFISIHTGASIRHQIRGITIYRFKESSFHNESPSPGSIKSLEQDEPETAWNDIQSRHLSSSERVAEIFKSRISEFVHFSTCKIRTAPLMVLRGVDMPAILIEIGHLTNPGDEKALEDAASMTKFAVAIRRGIDDFFKPRGSDGFPD